MLVHSGCVAVLTVMRPCRACSSETCAWNYHQHSERVATELSLLLVGGPLTAFQRGACSTAADLRDSLLHKCGVCAADVTFDFLLQV